MHPFVAITLRRTALYGAGLAATLVGHLLGGAHVHVLPVAPFAWVGLLSLTVLMGSRRSRPGFAAWSPVRVLAALVVAQAGWHVALHCVPWAFGLAPSQDAAVLTPGMVLAHAAVAVALLLPLCWGQRVLAGAVAVTRALRRVMRPRRRHRRPAAALRTAVARPMSVARHRPRTSRGPPRRRACPVAPSVAPRPV